MGCRGPYPAQREEGSSSSNTIVLLLTRPHYFGEPLNDALELVVVLVAQLDEHAQHSDAVGVVGRLSHGTVAGLEVHGVELRRVPVKPRPDSL